MRSGYDLLAPGGPTLRTFSYGVDGMPSQIVFGAQTQATTANALYDDGGVRVRKMGAQTTIYVGSHFEVKGGVPHRYVFANGLRIALVTPSATYYFHKDHLGSTRAITSATGATVWTGTYEPFGRLRSESGPRVSAYLFTDHEFDSETGLYYFGARYYDPASGLFTSPDSIVARPFDPQSLNRYAYVGGKPLSRVDPDGHDWIDDVGAFLVTVSLSAWETSLWAARAAPVVSESPFPWVVMLRPNRPCSMDPRDSALVNTVLDQ
jgi:RHS repeat-associated protein